MLTAKTGGKGMQLVNALMDSFRKDFEDGIAWQLATTSAAGSGHI